MATDPKKISFFLPNTFTALNIGCGFLAIVFASQGLFYKASMVIILGAVFDLVDGRVARLTGTESPFGEQFDSLSDLVSFGLAPSLIFYFRFLQEQGRLGIVACFLFLLCGALRLARFNVNTDKVNPNYFQGLPIPMGALALVGFTLTSSMMEKFSWSFWPAFYVLFYAFLMISNIPFPSFKKSDWVKKKGKHVLAIIFVFVLLVYTYREIMLFFSIGTYTLASIIYYGTHKKKFQDVFDWDEE